MSRQLWLFEKWTWELVINMWNWCKHWVIAEIAARNGEKMLYWSLDVNNESDNDMVDTEWHTGDVIPRILSDFDGGGRSTNGYVAGARYLNTLRYYRLSDGAVVALTARQTAVSTTTSFIHADSLSRRLPIPRTISRPTGSISTAFFLWNILLLMGNRTLIGCLSYFPRPWACRWVIPLLSVMYGCRNARPKACFPWPTRT